MPVVERQAKAKGRARESINLPKHVFTMRCIVRPYKDAYVAECIDLNLLVRRKTAKDAASALEDAIFGYLEAVVEDRHSFEELESSGCVKGLLPRPSPFARRAKYHLYCFLAAIQGSQRSFQLKDYVSSQFSHC